MIAIRLTKANSIAIANASPISGRDLMQMIETFGDRDRDSALYFVPQHDLAHSLEDDSWMTVPRKALVELYDFDDSKIDDEFTQITQK